MIKAPKHRFLLKARDILVGPLRDRSDRIIKVWTGKLVANSGQLDSLRTQATFLISSRLRLSLFQTNASSSLPSEYVGVSNWSPIIDGYGRRTTCCSFFCVFEDR